MNALELVDVSEDELSDLDFVAGFMGPLDVESVKVIYDIDTKDAANMICGANELDYHFCGVDFSVVKDAVFADLTEVKEGDNCPHCAKKLSYTKGIEVGHIFKLGTTYSQALKAEYLDENGKAKPFIMGTYGMGVSRLVAAVIEQHHDEKGCIWTKECTPYMVNIMVSNIKDEEQLNFGEELYKKLQDQNVDVIIDDRKERFGFKMKDAELIGFPYTVIVGKELVNGNVQIFDRKADLKTDVSTTEVYLRILELIK